MSFLDKLAEKDITNNSVYRNPDSLSSKTINYVRTNASKNVELYMYENDYQKKDNILERLNTMGHFPSRPLHYYGEKLKKLGDGGYGIVLHYDGGEYPTDVAIKIIADDNNALEIQGIVEIATLRLLTDHPFKYIVEIIDAPVVEEYNLAITLPLAELGSLDYSIRHFNSKSKTIVSYQISCAVAYIHHLGIIHRDLKPQNILVFGTIITPIAKLVDFGTALVNSCVDRVHLYDNVTTINYAAPEILLGQHHTFATDVWSLGAIIYEIYTTEQFLHPYGEDSYNSILAKLIGRRLGPPPFVSLARRLLSKEVMKADIQLALDESAKLVPYGSVFYSKKVISSKLQSLLNTIFLYDGPNRYSAYDVVTDPIFNDIRQTINEFPLRVCEETLVDISDDMIDFHTISRTWNMKNQTLAPLYNRILDIIEKYRLGEDIYEVTICLLDRCMSQESTKQSTIMLLSAVCLYTATMIRRSFEDVHDKNAPNIHELIEEYEGRFSVNEIITKQKEILTLIDYRIYFLVPYDYSVLNHDIDMLSFDQLKIAQIVRMVLVTYSERERMKSIDIYDISINVANVYHTNEDLSQSDWIDYLPVPYDAYDEEDDNYLSGEYTTRYKEIYDDLHERRNK